VISLRLSQWKQQDVVFKLAPTPQALESWLGPLADAGVDVFHCSQRRFWEPEFEGSALNFAGWAKKLTGKTIDRGRIGRTRQRSADDIFGRRIIAFADHEADRSAG